MVYTKEQREEFYKLCDSYDNHCSGCTLKNMELLEGQACIDLYFKRKNGKVEESEIIIKIKVKDYNYHEPKDFVEQITKSLDYSNQHCTQHNSLHYESIEVKRVE